MSTLDNRSGSAVLVIDPQIGVVEGTFERDAVIAAVGRLVERARGAGVPVLWVQHNDEHVVRGSDGWHFVPELTPAPDEPVVEKSYADAFEATTLEDELAALGVARLVVAGAETDACVRSTVHGGLTRGYDVTLVSDAHTTRDLSAWGAPPPELVIAHTNLYWSEQSAPGRTGGTATVEKVDLDAAGVGVAARQ